MLEKSKFGFRLDCWFLDIQALNILIFTYTYKRINESKL